MAEIEAEKAAYAEKFKVEEKVYEEITSGDIHSLESLQKSCPEGVNPAAK